LQVAIVNHHPNIERDEISPLPIGSMEEFSDRDPRIHDIRYLGDDGANVFVEWQGTLVVVTVKHGPRKCPARGKRGKCLPFSPASRLRLFRLINRLDWNRAGRTTFFTGTWRDDVGRPEPADLTKARSWFKRDLELKCCKPISGLWRVEWKSRLSGKKVGHTMPHVHTLLFNMPYIDMRWWYEKWAMCIGTNKSVDVDVSEVWDLKHCMNYVAKYIGKPPDGDCLRRLGIEAYLNYGRAWGKYRADLLPYADGALIRVPPGNLVKRIRAVATAAWHDCPQAEQMGFSVFGVASQKITELLESYVDNVAGGGVGYPTAMGNR
jgi:hypothetical protein